jgi:hypothetical protein
VDQLQTWETNMFCSECGKKAEGKFCWKCGHPLQQLDAESLIPFDQVEGKVVPPSNWRDSIDCQAIISVPEARARIADHASRAKKKFSGEDFLECCDSLFGSLTGGVPLSIVAKIAQPLSEKLGLKTGKQRTERLAGPPGCVLVAVLCSLAERGQQLSEINQAPTSCTIRASLPSDVWALKGELLVNVRVDNGSTFLEAETIIPGQIYDWGKSNRALDRLFADITQLAKAA